MEKDNKNYRDIILSEAKRIAIKQGIAKIDIRSVAKNSGIAIGTVYNYFSSKGDLLAAVIEEFWDHAFENFDLESFPCNDFFGNIEKLYSILYANLSKFKENWLEQLAFLKTQEKLLGKKKQDEYFEKICDKIIYLMDADEHMKQYIKIESVSKEKLAEFIFDNMLIMLRKGEKDMHFFTEILRKITKN